MSTVVCSTCLAVNDDAGQYCRSCGRPLHGPRRWVTTPAAAEDEVQSSEPQAATAGTAAPGLPAGWVAPPPQPPAVWAPRETGEEPEEVPVEPVRVEARAVADSGREGPYRVVAPGEIPRVVVHAFGTPGAVDGVRDDEAYRPGDPGHCRNCGRQNPSDSWFCASCGEPLRLLPSAVARYTNSGRPTTPTPTGLVAPTGKIRRKAFKRAMHRGGPRRRWIIRYDRPLGTRAFLFRSILTTLLVAVVLLAVLPVASPVRNLIFGKPPLKPVAVRSATLDRPGQTIAGHPPHYAVDGTLETSWSVRWNAAAPEETGSGACSEATIPAFAKLIVGFSNPQSLDEVRVAPGTVVQRPGQLQPRVIDLLFSDGTCKRLTLADNRATQTFPLSTGSVKEVTVNIVAAFPQPEGVPATQAGETFVAIRSIQFLHRG